jgi:hypothetical protein
MNLNLVDLILGFLFLFCEIFFFFIVVIIPLAVASMIVGIFSFISILNRIDPKKVEEDFKNKMELK